jgi:hypothetical protein
MAEAPDTRRGQGNSVQVITPVRGLVVRHAFLWSHEKSAGREEGSKDRPAVIVLLTKPDETAGLRVGVVPVTHTPPADPEGGIEVSDAVKRLLSLDNERQWIVFDEINRFVWPGYDLRKVPGTGADSYGMLPEVLFQEILNGILARHRAHKSIVIDRD